MCPRPAHPSLFAIREREHRALLDRARLRALELKVGESTDDDGSYWLARTAGLEHVASAAEDLVAGRGSIEALREVVLALNDIQAPACRTGDHQVAV